MTISSSETTTGVFDPAMTAAAMSPSTAPMTGRMATTQGWSNRLSFSIGSPKGMGNRAASEPSVGRRKPRATPRPTHTRPMTMMSVRPSLKTAGPEGVPGLLSVLTAILTLRNWLCETGSAKLGYNRTKLVHDCSTSRVFPDEGRFARERRSRNAEAGSGGSAEGVAVGPGGGLAGLDARDRERDRRRADDALSAFRRPGDPRRRGGPPRRAQVRSGRPGRPPGVGNRPRSGRADVRAALHPPRGPDADVRRRSDRHR